ncbi:MAG: hypothetical protein ACLVJ8_16000 [Ruthenibacterium lactatiformans]
MSKIKMLLDVVQDMRSLTDSLEALARAIEEPEEQQGDAVRMEQIAESVPASHPQPATESQQATAETAPVADNPAPAAPKPPTLVELRVRGGALHAPDPPQDRRAVGWHGVAKLADLPERAYLDLMRR